MCKAFVTIYKTNLYNIWWSDLFIFHLTVYLIIALIDFISVIQVVVLSALLTVLLLTILIVNNKQYPNWHPNCYTLCYPNHFLNCHPNCCLIGHPRLHCSSIHLFKSMDTRTSGSSLKEYNSPRGIETHYCNSHEYCSTYNVPYTYIQLLWPLLTPEEGWPHRLVHWPGW